MMELKAIAKDKGAGGVWVEPRSADCTKLDCRIKGPEDTPYEEGMFLLDCSLPDDYPFNPPKIK